LENLIGFHPFTSAMPYAGSRVRGLGVRLPVFCW
jgi:hypothetical protein